MTTETAGTLIAETLRQPLPMIARQGIGKTMQMPLDRFSQGRVEVR
jgi:hypothetical protein